MNWPLVSFEYKIYLFFFQVTAAECKTIIDNMSNQSNFQMSGIRAGGVKYM